MSLDGTAARLESGLPRLVKEMVQLAQFRMQRYFEGHLDTKGPPRGVRSTSSQTGAQSGRLSRSLVKGQSENISRFEVAGRSYRLVFGTRAPYAITQNRGATISHPGSSKRQAFRGADGRLVVTSHTRPHTIVVPGRHFFDLGLKDFAEREWPRLLGTLMADAMKLARG